MEENLQMRTSAAKACFSRLGAALVLIAVITSALQVVLGVAAKVYMELTGVDLNSISWVMWAMTFVPLYAVGVPVGLTVLKGMSKDEGTPTPLGVGRFWTMLLICFPVMYVGNLVGTVLSSLLSGGTAVNGLESYALDNSIWKVLVMVVLAPLVEEYVFRKQLMDRCLRYGEKTAVVFSALTFGLFHMNLFQFFYAFGLGLIFAYVYLKTRRLRYCVAMHMAINFTGSVLAPWVVSQLDMDALSNLSSQTLDEATLAAIAPGLLLFLGYMLVYLALVVVGLVLLVVKRKQVEFHPAPEELPREGRLKVVYGNPGVIVFMVLCAIAVVSSLLPV